MSLAIGPCTLRDASAFIGREHRHHPPTRGHKASLAVRDEVGTLRGVAVIGRPVSRALDQAGHIEVTRVATDGTANACSMLYGAARRLGVALGYPPHKVITYTLAEESGVSLRAAGWVRVAEVRGESWNRPGRTRVDSAPTTAKVRWHASRPVEEETR